MQRTVSSLQVVMQCLHFFVFVVGLLISCSLSHWTFLAGKQAALYWVVFVCFVLFFFEYICYLLSAGARGPQDTHKVVYTEMIFVSFTFFRLLDLVRIILFAYFSIRDAQMFIGG